MKSTDTNLQTEAGVSIVIPVFNEEKAVVETIEGVRNAMDGAGNSDYEIIVVDDGSVDDTPDLLRPLDIELITHSFNRGYGASLKTGIQAAKYEIIAIIDADGTYPAEKMPELVAHMREHDMAVGARTEADAKIPVLRRIPKLFLQRFASYVVKYPIPDLNSGLRVFRKNIALNHLHILPSGFSFTSTLTLLMIENSFRVKYIPINYYLRQGDSKIRPFIDTGSFFSTVLRTSLYFSPLRVFVPASGFIFLLTLLKFLYDIQYRPLGHIVISQTVVLLGLVALQIFILGLIADLIVRRTSSQR